MRTISFDWRNEATKKFARVIREYISRLCAEISKHDRRAYEQSWLLANFLYIFAFDRNEFGGEKEVLQTPWNTKSRNVQLRVSSSRLISVSLIYFFAAFWRISAGRWDRMTPYKGAKRVQSRNCWIPTWWRCAHCTHNMIIAMCSLVFVCIRNETAISLKRDVKHFSFFISFFCLQFLYIISHTTAAVWCEEKNEANIYLRLCGQIHVLMLSTRHFLLNCYDIHGMYGTFRFHLVTLSLAPSHTHAE